jgi:AraC-like DNA-binding protein
MGRFPKKLCETHSLGPATKEWLIGHQQVPGLGAAPISYAGFTEARQGYSFVRHNPAFSQILVSVEGEGEVLVDGAWAPCPTGLAYITAPRALNAYHIRPKRRWRLHWVIYPETTRLPTLEPGQPPKLLTVDPSGFRLAVEGLCHEGASWADPAILSFWTTIVDRMVHRMLSSPVGDPRLNRLWLQVRENIGGEWNLPRLARCAGMSDESLRRACLSDMQRSPMSHLTRMRMLIAADMCCHTSERISEIAARVGYGNAFAFSTAFKRLMGLSPRQFRAVGTVERHQPAATAQNQA